MRRITWGHGYSGALLSCQVDLDIYCFLLVIIIYIQMETTENSQLFSSLIAPLVLECKIGFYLQNILFRLKLHNYPSKSSSHSHCGCTAISTEHLHCAFPNYVLLLGAKLLTWFILVMQPNHLHQRWYRSDKKHIKKFMRIRISINSNNWVVSTAHIRVDPSRKKT